jgi:ankyrin repeat protein
MRELFPATAILFAVSGALWCAPGDAASLFDAVKAGNLPAVQRTLQRTGPNQAETDGTTALHWAVQEDRLDIVQALVKAGADANAKNHYGLTPLAWAVNNGNAGITEQLLKAGADPRLPVPEMGTALLAAARTGNPRVISALLKAGVNANDAEPKTGQTALMWAAAEGHQTTVKALLAAGADSKARSRNGESAMFFAVRRGDVGVAEILLAAGADANDRAPDETVNTKTVSGDTMLVVAILNGHFGMANFLLNNGADPNAAGARWTALHALSRVRDYEESQYPPPIITPGELDSLELGRRLIAHGANPNARALTTTARRNPGDQNYKDLIGATPFFLAAKSGDVPYMRLLHSAGADAATSLNDHTSPLMVAAGIGCVPGQWVEPERDILAAVKFLVEELKADVNAVNDRNENALHGVVCRGEDSVLQYLVDKGVRLDVKDVDGKTPLGRALTGLYLPVAINGPPLNIVPAQEHTIALLKKLTERAAVTQTAQR